MDFWDFFWLLIWTFLFVAFLMVLFQIFGDLFRDRDLGGFAKAVWVIALIVFPFLAILIYLIARGKGMAERQADAMRAARQSTDEYIQSVAGSSVARRPDRLSQVTLGRRNHYAGRVRSAESQGAHLRLSERHFRGRRASASQS